MEAIIKITHFEQNYFFLFFFKNKIGTLMSSQWGQKSKLGMKKIKICKSSNHIDVQNFL